jgi:(S)-2-hydroxyglutarate dehydrogenase
MSDRQCDIAIIGAGIVGLAVGLQLVRQDAGLRILVLEKEPEIAVHQTGRNSGVIHSGLYYKPGSLKARLCVEGAMAMAQFCRDYGIPHEICGKVIVATSQKEIPALEELLRRGRANGVANLQELSSSEEIREIEPNAAGIRGIYVPGTGITDYRMVAQKYAEMIKRAGSDVLTSAEVRGIASGPNEVVLETTSDVIHARFVVNCAGLQSDRIAKLAGASLGIQIVPFRGEYYEIVPAKAHLIRGLIYPVPDPAFPFLGVHFTKRIHGGVEAGPNAVLAFRREGYARTSFDLADTACLAASGGFWRMGAKYWRMGLGEFYRSFSKRAFTAALQKLLPALTEDDIRPGGSGVRAQALDRSGGLLDDFHFAQQHRILHVCNVPSPAATASLLIGREIATRLNQSGWSLRSSHLAATASHSA